MNMLPPKWIDRFLVWYCDPDLLEEIQGDARELYFERLSQEGKTKANWKYAFDIIRFCRWSNIHKLSDGSKPGYFDILWNLNIKLAFRNAARNKLIFSAKILSLSNCLAFALLLSVFVLQEYSFDNHIKDHKLIYRIGTQIDIEGVVSRDAQSAELLADTMEEEIPEIEIASWYADHFFNFRHILEFNEKRFYNEKVLATNSKIVSILDLKFLQGEKEALEEIYSIVLTESSAKKIFGSEDPMGKTIDFNGNDVDVSGIIEDPPSSSHVEFDALVSWEGYPHFCDCWSDVGVYTYIKIKKEAQINIVQGKIEQLMNKYKMNMAEDKKFLSSENLSVTPIIENITDLHLGAPIKYDTTKKRSKINLHILIVAAILFFLTGFINFLNLSLAELTLNFKKLGILKVFGGSTAISSKAIYAELFLSIIVVFPLTTLLFFIGIAYANDSLNISIENHILYSMNFGLIIFAFVSVFLFTSKMCSFIISKSSDVLNAIKGKLNVNHSGYKIREILVGVQLSFSIIIIAIIFIIVDQFTFINETDKGFEDKNTLVVKIPFGSFSETTVFENTLSQIKGVNKTAASSFYIDEINWGDAYEIELEDGKKGVIVKEEYWGYGFTDLLNIKIVEGRDFDKNIKSDQYQGFLVNETAVKAFGWQNPIGKKINHGRVIGVIKDFNTSSLHHEIEPLIVYHGASDYWDAEYVFLKLDPLRSTHTISKIEKQFQKFYPENIMEWEYLDAALANLYRQDFQVRDILKIGLLISLFVSCLGIFSISALLVLIKAKEMGIRKIVGASQLQLFGLHIFNFTKFIVIAVSIAWPVTYYLSNHWLNNFAYRIDLSAWYFIVPGLLTLMVILITSGFHGLKNSNINPIEVLNQE
ncbi:MAG: ABC transporter permease [Reichenbachiella sp.]